MPEPRRCFGIAGRAFMISARGNDSYSLKAEKLRQWMPFKRETPSSIHRTEIELCIDRQRINQLLTKTADP